MAIVVNMHVLSDTYCTYCPLHALGLQEVLWEMWRLPLKFVVLCSILNPSVKTLQYYGLHSPCRLVGLAVMGPG